MNLHDLFDGWYIRRLCQTMGGILRFAWQILLLLSLVAVGIAWFLFIPSMHYYVWRWVSVGIVVLLGLSYIESFIYMRKQPLAVDTESNRSFERESAWWRFLEFVGRFF